MTSQRHFSSTSTGLSMREQTQCGTRSIAILCASQQGERRIAPPKLHVPGLSFEKRNILLNAPLMKNLAPEFQEKLLNAGMARSLRRGEFLFMAGDPVQSVYCLLSGKLKEYYANESGNACLRCIQIPGSCISLHMTFAETRRHSYYCEAVNPSIYFSWDAEFFLRLARQEPSLGLQVAAAISGYFENSCHLNSICRKRQAASRVAGYLLYRCSNCAKMSADIRPVGLTAHDICLRRETFSKVLSSLRKKRHYPYAERHCGNTQH